VKPSAPPVQSAPEQATAPVGAPTGAAPPGIVTPSSVPPSASVAEAKPATPESPDTAQPAAAAKPSRSPRPKGQAPLKSAAPATVAASSPTPPAPKPQLDFNSLVQRLRDTSAIGVFTKLSIKNQVDDLLGAFRGYYAGRVPPSIDDLHERYDGLVLKVVTLVQNGDASLASAISASRGAIWEKLSNRESFQAI
jgi:hypothetical protein